MMIEGRSHKLVMRQVRSPLLLIGIMVAFVALGSRRTGAAVATVELLRAPHGGIQPQAAIDSHGVLHLVYLAGDPGAADVYYVRRAPGAEGWSPPLRVNTHPGSAIAIGTIRGAQLALGRNGRVHVVWNGSDRALPRNPTRGAPLLYTRMNGAGTGFEPERNLMQFTFGLDGGASVAADPFGDVDVVWHGQAGSGKGESSRRLWIARSTNGGKTFSREAPAYAEPTGACGCCGARAFADRHGSVYALYRAATAGVDRDMILLTSRDRGARFEGTRLHHWKLNACPMSSESFAESPADVLAAWETRGQVYFTAIDPATLEPGSITAAPGSGDDRKHPTVAGNARGETLLAWTEGTGWQKGGSLAWQLFDRSGKPMSDKGRLEGVVPVWGLATAVARPDGGFTIVY